MVDHRELFEDVTADLARAGFDTDRGPSGLRIDQGPQGVLIGWPPSDGDAAEPPPAEGIRTAVTGAVATVLRESGYLVTAAGPDELLVTADPARAAAQDARAARAAQGAQDAQDADGREPAGVPEQWWG
ncbi:hypothetical protein ACFP3U_01325 [Kitasatospora misakiensis]|uniref:Uncharacterized protein n=1 Tax=Kitasatospora misakiensis TaxID=67330 RepID=A0ABW0WTM4_9ACTN